MSYQDLAAWPEDWTPWMKTQPIPSAGGLLARVLFQVQHRESGEWISAEYAGTAVEDSAAALAARLNDFIQQDARPGEFYVRHYRPDPNEPSRVLGWIPITHVKVRQ